eukprot:RCo007510
MVGRRIAQYNIPGGSERAMHVAKGKQEGTTGKSCVHSPEACTKITHPRGVRMRERREHIPGCGELPSTKHHSTWCNRLLSTSGLEQKFRESIRRQKEPQESGKE